MDRKLRAQLTEITAGIEYRPDVVYTHLISSPKGSIILMFDKDGEYAGVSWPSAKIAFKTISSENYRTHPDQVVDKKIAAARVQDHGSLFIKPK